MERLMIQKTGTLNRFFLTGLLAVAFTFGRAQAEPEGFVPIKEVRASSEREGHPANNVADGDHTDDSRWLSEAREGTEWIEIELPQTETLLGLHLYSGYQGRDPITDFIVQFKHEHEWVDIPSTDITGNTDPILALHFDETVDVITDTLRLWITRTPHNIARIAGIVVWSDAIDQVPVLQTFMHTPRLVFLNQAGFNSGEPKRFTAPTLADGTAFVVVPAAGGEPVYQGVIEGHIGDLTDFEPGDQREYLVQAGDYDSVAFRVAPRLLEQFTYQPAMDFMIDTRHYVGNDRRLSRRSFGWRDDHAFAWQLHTLVPQWLSNPAAYRNMPRQVVYEAPEDPSLWGALEPPRAEAPDIVKLIHWGADVIVTQNLSHEFLKAQLAYFLYAWPWLQDYLPRQNYERVFAYAFTEWTNPDTRRSYPHDESPPDHNLLALKTHIGTSKGGYPPGFSVRPNLLMYEVAKRENRSDADSYFKAAYNQAAWMIEHLDWNDPLVTKGQRVSEFITMTGLAHFMQEYPDRAPAGLRAKINEWAEVVVRRSDNLWDFRKLGDGPDEWVPIGPRPQMWNEPGNVVGVPAIIMAALPFVDEASTRDRLWQLVWSHFDNMFGRNPVGRHFGFRAHEEIAGVEYGWFSRYPGGIGRLEHARFVLDGAPKNEHYPFNPELGNIGWTEGWIQHNVPFNLSLAYLARETSQLSLERSGRHLAIRLEAPVRFEGDQPGTAQVTLTFADGESREVQLTESAPQSGVLTGRFPLRNAPRTGTVTAQYGYDFMRITQEISL